MNASERKRIVAEKRAARLANVRRSVATINRLVSWLSFLRRAGDSGAGDTATRLLAQCEPHADAHEQLTRLLKQCGCEKTEARVRLNERFPFPSPQSLS